jgi:hypothetical protein
MLKFMIIYLSFHVIFTVVARLPYDKYFLKFVTPLYELWPMTWWSPKRDKNLDRCHNPNTTKDNCLRFFIHGIVGRMIAILVMVVPDMQTNWTTSQNPY